MQATLVVQQGPRTGHTYALDPRVQAAYSMGRGAACDIVILDPQSSRHHCDIRWNGHQWQILDRGSTNGTFVNNVPVRQPAALQPGSTIGIGGTTLVLRQQAAQPVAPLQPLPSAPPAQPTGTGQPGPLQPVPIHAPPSRGGQTPAGAAAEPRTSTGVQVAFWLVQVIIGASVVCLAAGALLPWFRVSGSLSSELQSLIGGVSDIVSSFIGKDLLSVTQDINALSGFGGLTLGLAVVAGIMLIVDLFLRRSWVVASLVYLLPSAAVGIVIARDMKDLYDLYEQFQTIELLFGIELADVVKAFDNLFDVEVSFLPGLYLTVIGLGLLVVGGLARLVVALLARGD